MTSILAFDTSGPQCAVALMVNGAIAAERQEDMTRGQAERLFPMFDEVLAEVGAVWEELDALAVGTGPGNFTGIRISVSAARGLALSLGVPAIGVSGFEALRGERFLDDTDPMLVSLPSTRRGMDVILQYYETAAPLGAPVDLAIFGKGVIDPDFKGFPRVAHVLGHEAPAVDVAVQDEQGEYTWLEFGERYPHIEQIAKVAAKRLESGQTLDRPAPLYARAADAAPSRDLPPPILP